MHNSLLTAMHAGLNREIKMHCSDVNNIARDPFKEFVTQQLNASKLDYDFFDLKFLFTRNEFNDAVIPKAPVLLMNGGINSTIALLYLIDIYQYKNITALFIPYGAPHNDVELQAFRKLKDVFLEMGYHAGQGLYFRELAVTATPLEASKFGSGYTIPLKNALLAAYAVMFGDSIFMGVNWRKTEALADDESLAFFNQISELLSLQYQQPIRVWSPFLHWKKEQAITWLMNRFPKNYLSILHATSNCHKPVNNKACGACYPCWKAARAFRTVNIWDALQDKFLVNPFTTSLAALYAKLWEQSEKG